MARRPQQSEEPKPFQPPDPAPNAVEISPGARTMDGEPYEPPGMIVAPALEEIPTPGAASGQAFLPADRPEPVVPKKFIVTNHSAVRVILNGAPTWIPPKKVIYETAYDLSLLRRQGVTLEAVED